MHWDSELSNELWIGARERANGQLVKDASILADNTKKIIGYPGGHVEGFPDSFKQNFRQIYAAIAAGSAADSDFADFEVGVREMMLGEKIIQSARERRWITI